MKALFAICGALLACSSHAQVQVTTGIDYSEGKYGGTVTSKQTAVPLVLKYSQEAWSVKASVPYVWVSNVNPDAQGESLPCGSASQTPKNVDGFADAVLSASYSAYAAGNTMIDLNGKIKLATGDTDKCLSSGEEDYSWSVDLTQQLHRLSVFATLGLTLKGDPMVNGQTINYRDPVFASVGAQASISPQAALGFSYDYRQALTDTGSAIRELTLFWAQKLPNNTRLQSYAVTGFSDASVDLGVGVMLSHRY